MKKENEKNMNQPLVSSSSTTRTNKNIIKRIIHIIILYCVVWDRCSVKRLHEVRCEIIFRTLVTAASGRNFDGGAKIPAMA